MLLNFLLVALGGALGSVARYSVGLALARASIGGIPLPVMFANIVGSFLMGVATAYFLKRGLANLSPFVTVGFLGGFTTFSTFSLEAVKLIQSGLTAQSVTYVLITVVGSVLALTFGIFVVQILEGR